MRIFAVAVLVFSIGCVGFGHRRSRQPASDADCITDRVMSVHDSLKEKLANMPGFLGIGVGTMCDPRDMAKYAGIAPSSEPPTQICGVAVEFDSDAHMRDFAKQYYSVSPEPGAVALCPSVHPKVKLQ